jgi:hypothetical protein
VNQKFKRKRLVCPISVVALSGTMIGVSLATMLVEVMSVLAKTTITHQSTEMVGILRGTRTEMITSLMFIHPLTLTVGVKLSKKTNK